MCCLLFEGYHIYFTVPKEIPAQIIANFATCSFKIVSWVNLKDKNAIRINETPTIPEN